MTNLDVTQLFLITDTFKQLKIVFDIIPDSSEHVSD